MPRLYHYTTAEGLKGILEGRSVWASDYRFLNDSLEFHYGVSVFRNVLNTLNHGLERLGSGDIKEQINNTLDGVSKDNVSAHQAISFFVASFSEAPDLLSQWRGYNGGRGYSIGFDHHWLGNSAGRHGFNLSPVAYAEVDQRQVFIDRINLLSTMLLNRGATDEHVTMQQWYMMLFQTIACCKHPSFSEEREYRAIRVQYGWPDKTLTRSSSQGLIPYIPMVLDGERDPGSHNHPQNLGFEHIIVGPAYNSKQIIAVDAMLSRLHMRFKVTKSIIPFVAQ